MGGGTVTPPPPPQRLPPTLPPAPPVRREVPPGGGPPPPPRAVGMAGSLQCFASYFFLRANPFFLKFSPPPGGSPGAAALAALPPPGTAAGGGRPGGPPLSGCRTGGETPWQSVPASASALLTRPGRAGGRQLLQTLRNNVGPGGTALSPRPLPSPRCARWHPKPTGLRPPPRPCEASDTLCRTTPGGTSFCIWCWLRIVWWPLASSGLFEAGRKFNGAGKRQRLQIKGLDEELLRNPLCGYCHQQRALLPPTASAPSHPPTWVRRSDHSITDYEAGRDLRNHQGQPFLAKARLRQDSPTPCTAES